MILQLLIGYCFVQCCWAPQYNWWERSCELCISKLSWTGWQWEDNCEQNLTFSLSILLICWYHFHMVILIWIYLRIHALLQWRNMALVLVVLVVFTGQLVSTVSLSSLEYLWKRSSILIISIFVDAHLDCETRISKFLGTPDSVLYSYGISTIFSVIPAFCKKGDIIVA